MPRDSQLIFVGLMFAIAMAVIELAEQSWASQADAREVETCKDRGDTKAMMARLPGQHHNQEACVQFIRFGSPDWIPDFRSPLPPEKMPK